MLAQYNGDGLNEVKAVWYNGSTTLRTGYALCYDLDDTNAPVSLPAGSLTTPPTSSILPHNLRGRQVIDPVTGILGAVAGVVAPESTGVTGPAWVTLIVPRTGDVALFYTSANCTKNTTIFGTQNGSNVFIAASDSTFNTTAVALALETVDKSSTNGTVLGKFL